MLDGKYRTDDKLITENTKLNTTRKKNKHKIQQNKTSLVQSPFMTLGQEMRSAYCTMLSSPRSCQVI